MKLLTTLLLAFLLPLFSYADDSGTCGENLTWTYVNETQTLEISGNGAMDNYSETFGITSPWSRRDIIRVIINEGVTTIGDYAFSFCWGMMSIDIPNTVTKIGKWAFSGCGMPSIELPGSVNSLDEGVFSGCNNLVSINIPRNITRIEKYAFSHCEELRTIIIPSNVTFIGEQAFYQCSSLVSVTIPNSVTSIGQSAFEGCTSLASFVIPDGISFIESGTFRGCESLSSITIPNTVTCIKDGAPTGYHGGQTDYRGAFYGCSSLESVVLPQRLQMIGAGTFQQCSGLKTISIPSSVVTIGAGAFAECSNLTSVSIHDGLISIGTGAFASCMKLTDITIPNSVTHIESMAFKKCSSLISVNIPYGVTTIGSGSFIDCIKLASVTISNGVTKIEDMAFSGCTGLTTINIPRSMTSLGNSAFYGCSGLTSVTISNGITTISESTFENCSKMEILKLPVSLQIIKKTAFKGCNNLKEITIPASVEFIYQEAFANCNSLECIKVKPATPPFLYDNSFSDFSVPLEVPKGCKDEYQAAQGWENFTNVSESDQGYYELIYMVDNKEYKSQYIEEGARITPETAPMKEGYNFSGWSEIPETMPAHDVIVTGTFTINKYKLTYHVDGEEYKSYVLDYGTNITPETEPNKEGYTFSSWSEIPATMPAHEVTVTGSFSVNSYTVTFKYGDEVLITENVDYGAEIPLPESLNSDRYNLIEWLDVPATMPAHDITIQASFTDAVKGIKAKVKNAEYYQLNGIKHSNIQRGLNIVKVGNKAVKLVNK